MASKLRIPSPLRRFTNGESSIDVNGNNIKQILEAFNYVSEKPKLILANTTKGKGFSFSENNNDWHHKIMTKKQYDDALKELDDTKQNSQ